MHYPRVFKDKLTEYINDNKSILLLGPRQVGKTTVIESVLNEFNYEKIVYRFQYLSDHYKLIKDPNLIVDEVENKLKKGKTILYLDEVQKIPQILDNCQYLIDKYKKNLVVIITGSSARKLRYKGVNLLPGRLFSEKMYSLTFPEIMKVEEQRILPLKIKNSIADKVSLDDLLIYGTLPGVLAEEKKYKSRILKAYTMTYLEEEIRNEALTRNIEAFHKFLYLASYESGQTPNLSKISQETGIKSTTIKNYFQILSDTLITFDINPFMREGRKHVLSTPKYVFYDVGVRNAACGLPLNMNVLKTEAVGKLFEQLIITELIKRINYQYPDYKYSYWRTNNGLEVDFIIETEDEVIPIEIKYAEVPNPSHIKHLKIFMEEYNCKRGYVIGRFSTARKLTDNITGIPWNEI